jgi:hypothetical protein
MYTDALGNLHFEIWEGIKFNGRTFQSYPLYKLSQKFPEANIVEACHHLGCLPHVQDLSAIQEECERMEPKH